MNPENQLLRLHQLYLSKRGNDSVNIITTLNDKNHYFSIKMPLAGGTDVEYITIPNAVFPQAIKENPVSGTPINDFLKDKNFLYDNRFLLIGGGVSAGSLIAAKICANQWNTKLKNNNYYDVDNEYSCKKKWRNGLIIGGGVSAGLGVLIHFCEKRKKEKDKPKSKDKQKSKVMSKANGFGLIVTF